MRKLNDRSRQNDPWTTWPIPRFRRTCWLVACEIERVLPLLSRNAAEFFRVKALAVIHYSHS